MFEIIGERGFSFFAYGFFSKLDHFWGGTRPPIKLALRFFKWMKFVMLTDIEALLRKGENMGKNNIKRTHKRDKYKDQLDKENTRN